ncbi:uncharacterized protein LOC128210502 [Mya arenaria]|uniref:uncharacterized protein LOC128210502 n=1 Tax=Mya arenaria TaxID=6604 RepID=UPI0022E3637E|nr:uncharacterized protein LOC128210502 [Mya arenaria]
MSIFWVLSMVTITAVSSGAANCGTTWLPNKGFMALSEEERKAWINGEFKRLLEGLGSAKDDKYRAKDGVDDIEYKKSVPDDLRTATFAEEPENVNQSDEPNAIGNRETASLKLSKPEIAEKVNTTGENALQVSDNKIQTPHMDTHEQPDKKYNERLKQSATKGTDVEIPIEKEEDAMSIPEKTENSGRGVIELDWETKLKESDYNGIAYLLQNGISPTNNRIFNDAVEFLHERKDDLISLCRIISKHILLNIRHAKVIYPAKSPKNQKIYFVVLSTCPSDRKYFDEFPLKIKYAYTKSEEEQYIRQKEMNEALHFQSKEDEIGIINVIGKARKQFSKNPNISRISYSFYKSKRFGEVDREIDYIKKGCVVIFVYLKKWIPIGMDAFPKTFEGYNVDVRQAMMMKRHSTKISSDKSIIGSGTIQGNLKRRGTNNDTDTSYALTAAHAVLPDETLAKMLDIETPFMHKSDKNLVTSDVQKGEVEAVAYQGKPHIDVAAIALTAPLVEKEIVFDWMKYGFRRILKFPDSGIQCCHPKIGDVVLKYGETTGLTFGHVHDISAEIYDAGQTCLIEIWHIDPKSVLDFAAKRPRNDVEEKKDHQTFFSDVGDSGAFVYVVNPNALQDKTDERFSKNNDLGLVGMVTSEENGSYYSTYMEKNLLGLKNRYEFC